VKLNEIYQFFIKEGISCDIRSPKEIQKKFAESKRLYRKLSAREKSLFDRENFSNPYSDTRILNGDPKTDVRRIMVGIDIEAGEILLADRLCQRGEKIDLILAHHPEGKALANLDDVMGLQADLLKSVGFRGEIAKSLMDDRIKEVARRLHGGNHTRTVDAARLLDFPLLCCHTPSDNHVADYLQKMMDTQKPKTLQSIIQLLLKEPEYRDAVREKAGPTILLGKPSEKAGKVLVDMTGGTEGSKEIFARLSQSGIQTLLCMHLSEEHFNKIKSEHIHVIVAGHIASDNLGLNLLLDKLAKKSRFEFVECSGFRRISRG